MVLKANHKDLPDQWKIRLFFVVVGPLKGPVNITKTDCVDGNVSWSTYANCISIDWLHPQSKQTGEILFGIYQQCCVVSESCTAHAPTVSHHTHQFHYIWEEVLWHKQLFSHASTQGVVACTGILRRTMCGKCERIRGEREYSFPACLWAVEDFSGARVVVSQILRNPLSCRSDVAAVFSFHVHWKCVHQHHPPFMVGHSCKLIYIFWFQEKKNSLLCRHLIYKSFHVFSLLNSEVSSFSHGSSNYKGRVK